MRGLIITWVFRLIIVVNVLMWGVYLIGWDWMGFRNYPSHLRQQPLPSEILKYNAAQLALGTALVAGLVGLKSRLWSWLWLWHFLASAAMFGIFTLVYWDEYQFDESMGADRGAWEGLVLNALLLVINLIALCYVIRQNYKLRRQ